MEINKDFFEKMLKNEWMSRCSFEDEFEFDVEFVDSWKKAKKSLNGLKWENTCLDGREDFISQITLTHKELGGVVWNQNAEMIHKQYVMPLIKKISEMISDKEDSQDILTDLRYNIMSLFLKEYYSEFNDSKFLRQLEEIYLSGHLACGWKGKYPDGKFIVY